MTRAPLLARRLWNLIEPVHAVVYFAPEVHDAYRRIGLKGFWMGYFAGRAHPLGAASAELVTATFFNFQPAMVGRAIPDAWTFAAPAEVGSARLDAVGGALRRILVGSIEDNQIAASAALAAQATNGCELGGRPLFAAYASLPWPDEPLLRLWHATTLLREHRGDGHVTANLANGLSGLDTHILAVAGGTARREDLQPNRGWTDEEWSTAERTLVERGLLTDGRLTADGEWTRAEVEARTDQLASGPIGELGPDRTRRLCAALHPVADQIVRAGGIPVPNPMGLPWPAP